MANVAGHITVLTVVAFWLWLSLLSVLRRVRVPMAALIAAILSWVGAALSLTFIVSLLQRVRLWPFS